MKADSDYHWDWPSAALLIFIVFTAAVRLENTHWTPDLGYVESLAVLGTVLGLALGLSNFKRGTRSFLLFLYSIFTIPMQLSRIISSEETPLGQLSSLGGRLVASCTLLFNGKRIEDYIFFVTLMGILFWFVGIYSGYKLVKGRAILQVLLPSTIPILVIQYYDGIKPERIWGLAFYFFLALLLVGRINLINARERWEEQRVVVGSDPEFDLNKNILTAAAIIIFAAWLLPAPAAVLPTAANAWRKINEPFEAVRDRFDDILAALDTTRINNSAGDLYGNVMGLGRSAGSGDAELFTVQAPQNNIPRLYWRMRAYDTYENGTWGNNNAGNTPFDPGEGNLTISENLSTPAAIFKFNWQSSRSALLATPALPVWTSRKGSIQTYSEPDGKSDVLSWSVTPSVRIGDQYQVRALLPNPTQKELRASGDDYPAWVIEHYLEVPPSISPRYKQLAEEITGDLSNNYDKAEAITAYLRKNISYSDTVPTHPEGVEPLNWFLFDLKSGFCNYYASAEVMLLRSLRIPARMVVGFAQGQSGDRGFYSIRGQDAHAWPEVYFPGIGWVQFEPTVNQDVLVRPTGETSTNSGSSSTGGDFAESTRNNPRFDQEFDDSPGDSAGTGNLPFLVDNNNPVFWIIISTLAIVIIGILGWRMEQRQPFSKRIPRALKSVYAYYHLNNPNWLDRWILWSESSSAEHAFHAVNQALTWLEKPQAAYVTPAERAMLLKTILPEASSEIDILSSTLEKNLFTPVPIDTTNAHRASWRLRLTAIRKIINRKLYGE